MAIVGMLALMVVSCTSPVELNLDNPHDPNSALWVATRPSISRATLTPEYTINLLWIYADKYAVSFKIERRIYGTNTYALLGTVSASPGGYYYQYVDSSAIPVGHTYAYRVGVVGSAGAVTYSYDFLVDVY